MIVPAWGCTPPPQLDMPLHEAVLTTPRDLTVQRRRLHGDVLRDLPLRGTEEDLERLLLTFAELTSNGLRHGRGTVHVAVSSAPSAWLVDVTDAGVESPPVPAVGRDLAEGGMGLSLVAHLSSAHGWWPHAGRKHVWALVARSP